MNDVDPLMVDLIKKMLEKNDEERIDWKDVEKHEIFNREISDFL